MQCLLPCWTSSIHVNVLAVQRLELFGRAVALEIEEFVEDKLLPSIDMMTQTPATLEEHVRVLNVLQPACIHEGKAPRTSFGR